METAVLDAQGTAPASEAPPEPYALPETAPEPEPETAPADVAPETEPEAAPDEGRTYTAEELEAAKQEADKRVRGEWEKWRADTEAKAKREAELATYQQNQRVADANRQGNAHRYLAAQVKDAVENGRELDPQVLGNVTQALAQGARHDAHQVVGSELWQAVQRADPNYKPSAPLAQQAAEAARKYDYVGVAAAQFAMAVELGKQQARAEAEAAAAAKAQQASAKPPTAPKKAPSPTAVAGDAGKVRDPGTVLATADPHSPEYRKAFVAKYGFEP